MLRAEREVRCCVEGHPDGCGCSAGRAKATTCRSTCALATPPLQSPQAEAPRPSCGSAAVITEEQRESFGAGLYENDDLGALPDAAKLASLGCGNPTAVADLHEGETVLDLGSGGGIDVLLSARRVGPTGKAYGLDMTDEMLELARRNQREAKVENAEFLKGTIEDIPLPDDSVDVIISNCVINLSGDKPSVFREASRVLRPGGRFAVSDVVADPDMDDATRSDMEQWTGCIAGALTRDDFERELVRPGSKTSRSSRLTASTRAQPQRSFALAAAPEHARRRRSSSTIPRPSTGAGRTSSGTRSRSTSSETASSGKA